MSQLVIYKSEFYWPIQYFFFLVGVCKKLVCPDFHKMEMNAFFSTSTCEVCEATRYVSIMGPQPFPST